MYTVPRELHRRAASSQVPEHQTRVSRVSRGRLQPVSLPGGSNIPSRLSSSMAPSLPQHVRQSNCDCHRHPARPRSSCTAEPLQSAGQYSPYNPTKVHGISSRTPHIAFRKKCPPLSRQSQTRPGLARRLNRLTSKLHQSLLAASPEPRQPNDQRAGTDPSRATFVRPKWILYPFLDFWGSSAHHDDLPGLSKLSSEPSRAAFCQATMYLLQHYAENTAGPSFARIMQEKVQVLWIPHRDGEVNHYLQKPPARSGIARFQDLMRRETR